jgi:hypothetical protein
MDHGSIVVDPYTSSHPAPDTSSLIFAVKKVDNSMHGRDSICLCCLSAKVVAGDGKRRGWRRREHKRDAMRQTKAATPSHLRSSSGMGGSMRLTENARVRPGGATAVRTDLQRQAAVCTARASTTATATATGSLPAGGCAPLSRRRRGRAATRWIHRSPRLPLAGPTPEILQATPNILDRDGGMAPYALFSYYSLPCRSIESSLGARMRMRPSG